MVSYHSNRKHTKTEVDSGVREIGENTEEETE